MENTMHEDVPVSAESGTTGKRERTSFEDMLSTVLTFAMLVCMFIRILRDTSFAFIFATDILGVITDSYLLWLNTKVDGKSLKSQGLIILCLALFAFGVIGGILTLSGLV